MQECGGTYQVFSSGFCLVNKILGEDFIFSKIYNWQLGLGIIVSALPIIGNTYFQQKADRYAALGLEGNIEEYNKQIKINAITTLIRRIIWGLFFLSGIIWNFQTVYERGFSWITLIAAILGTMCFGFGIWGYKRELKRLKSLN